MKYFRSITNETEIYSFFEQFGKVIEAKLARNYYGTLFIHKEHAQLEEKYNLEKRKVILLISFIKKQLKLEDLLVKIQLFYLIFVFS